jgi:hypothetical protein
MSQYYITNQELNKLDLNTDNLFGIMPIYNFIIDKYKQILLLLLAFLIIYVVDYITYYNNLFYAIAPTIPEEKSNTFKKKSKKNKK